LAVITVIAAIATSCRSNRPVGIDSPQWNVNVRELQGELLHADSIILNIRGLLPVDDCLFVHHGLNTHEYSMYKIRHGSLVFAGNLIRHGNGPTEVNRARLHYLPESEALVAVTYNIYGKVIVIPYGKGRDIFDEHSWRVSQNGPLTSSAGNITPVDTANLLLQNMLNDRIFATYGIGAEALMNLPIKYPDTSPPLPPLERSGFIYRLCLAKRHGKRQFVYSYSNGHFVRIFELDGNNVRNVKTIFEETPGYTLHGDKVARAGTTKFGLRASTSANHIYIIDPKIVAGRRNEDIKRNGFPDGYSKEIYVCDWEGNPEVKYVLDRPVTYCAVDQAEQYIYAATVEDEIVRFRLPNF
jgi:hypothetical protein